MRKSTFIGLVICALASPAIADPTLTLSSPDDLLALTVGQTVEIDVTLSGLPVGDNIFNLNSSVLFDSEFTTVPSANNSGLTAIVGSGSAFDNSLQVDNLYSSSSLTAGAATGIFSESPNANSGAISQNGLYYSFLLQATSVGSGVIGFDTTTGANEYVANNTGYNYAPLPTEPGLSFTIQPAAVPEPSSVLLCGIAGLIVAGSAWRGRRSGSRARPVA